MINKNNSGAVVVCGHIASKQYNILLAEKSEPEGSTDAGWQFLCNSGLDEDVKSAQVWAFNEIIALEPSLKELLDQPSGTQIVRKNTHSPWKVLKK